LSRQRQLDPRRNGQSSLRDEDPFSSFRGFRPTATSKPSLRDEEFPVS